MGIFGRGGFLGKAIRNIGKVVKPLSKLHPLGAAYNIAKYGRVIGKPENKAQGERGGHLTSKQMTSDQKRAQIW